MLDLKPAAGAGTTNGIITISIQPAPLVNPTSAATRLSAAGHAALAPTAPVSVRASQTTARTYDPLGTQTGASDGVADYSW